MKICHQFIATERFLQILTEFKAAFFLSCTGYCEKPSMVMGTWGRGMRVTQDGGQNDGSERKTPAPKSAASVLMPTMPTMPTRPTMSTMPTRPTRPQAGRSKHKAGLDFPIRTLACVLNHTNKHNEMNVIIIVQ